MTQGVRLDPLEAVKITSSTFGPDEIAVVSHTEPFFMVLRTAGLRSVI